MMRQSHGVGESPLSTPSRQLADFVANFRFEDLPEHARERTRAIFLDAIGCALAGHEGDETGQIEPVATALGGPGNSTVIGGASLSLVGATLLNGYLITAVTACDVHRATLCHIAPEVVPPALAIAEQRDRSGRDLLRALALGFEVTTRLGLGMHYSAFRARGWHSPGVIGPFGGAGAPPLRSCSSMPSDSCWRSAWRAANPLARSRPSVITAVLALVQRQDLRPEQVARVKVGLSEAVYKMHGEIGWEGKFRALLSTRYVVAVVLADGQCWLDQFTPERIADPALDAFARDRVIVQVDPAVKGTGAVVEITDREGSNYVERRSVPRGDSADPLSRAEVEAKFRLAARGRLTETTIDQVIDRTIHLEEVARVSELTQLLRAPTGVLV
ncbi:MAG: MmgE/PrpD family protein [Chloroflexi bacterium]|nr:MmgE/PrpD family protein [Chloroflexota bacterium]